ncbi:MAG: amidase family protein [Actinomycetota bacterium]
MDGLCDRTAIALVRALRAREVSAREVLDAHLARIDRWNPVVNAIVTRTTELARQRAAGLDEALARGEEPGPLHGLPIAHKDLVDTAGIRTTYGSSIYADHVPDADEPVVTRARDAGAVLVGKTNTPEFGAGSHTFNAVFGATRNPYDVSLSAGGSSGGAAVALATGMVPIADGSDLGGSLRNPASFCNVVGFRPTLTGEDPLDLSSDGPMARTVADAALLWSVMADAPPVGIDGDVERSRVAWAPACGGTLPVEPEVASVVDAARPTFGSLGCATVDAYPDLDGAREAFFTLRARSFAVDYGDVLREHRDRLKATVVWNIERGLALGADDVDRAVERMYAVRASAARFFAHVDYLVQPVSQVPPFPVELEYPTTVAGELMTTYLDWMASCWTITVLGGPAVAVPCGFTQGGLPIGLQIVGRRGDDAGVLRLAHAFEQATGVGRIRPLMDPERAQRRPAG